MVNMTDDGRYYSHAPWCYIRSVRVGSMRAGPSFRTRRIGPFRISLDKTKEQEEPPLSLT